MSHPQRRFFALATLSVALSLSAGGAWADALRDRIEACSRNQDDAARLRCFDEAAAAARAEPAAASTGSPGAASGAEESRPKTPAVQTARIVSVSQPDGRRYRIVLDNDQVWQENEHIRDLELMPGQTIRIKAGVLGSFMLSVESGRSTRVRRVR